MDVPNTPDNPGTPDSRDNSPRPWVEEAWDGEGWPIAAWQTTDLRVGPCAWRATMLEDGATGYVIEHPSLIVVCPDDPPTLLQRLGPTLRECPNLPVMLGVHEPSNPRRLQERVAAAQEALQRDVIDCLVLWVEEPRDFEGSALMEAMLQLEDENAVRRLGLRYPRVQGADWLAEHEMFRLLMLPYSLDNQSARYQALATAGEMEIACIADCECPQDGETREAMRFALGNRQRVLPVLDKPIPDGLKPMSAAEIEQHWERFQREHGLL